MSITRIIGIDFGTSTSVIRVKRYKEDGQPVDDLLYTVEVKFGNIGLVPTLIQKIPDGLPYYGYEAQKPRKKSELFQSFKVDLESQNPEIREQARALTEEFFAYMAKRYKDQSSGGFFGEAGDTEKTLVSYPVKWSEETRKFMLEAAKKAGFSNVEGVDEAQAAITAVMVQSKSYLSEKGYLHDGTPVNILMIDMGAGTTDLVLCRYTPGKNAGYEVLSAWPREGKTFFGGREIEELLQEYLRSKLPEEDADDVMKRCGLSQFKSWKETTVSPALERNQTVTEFYEFDSWVDGLEIDMEDYSLDRAELERLAINYLRGFPRLVNGCLKDAGIPGGEVDLVLLTGGHSQWYFVAELLNGKMSQCGEIDLSKIKADPGRIIPVPRPQETVALGLVYNPLMEQIRFAAKSEPKLASEPVQQPTSQPVPQPAPEPTPQSIPKPAAQMVTDSEVWDESMRVLPLTPEEEFEFREVGGEYEVLLDSLGSKSRFYNIPDGYEVVKYLGHREVVSIPAQYKGKPVVAIGRDAFEKDIWDAKTLKHYKGNAWELREVEIPGRCIAVSAFAFSRDKDSANSISLEKVVLHRGLRVIGIGAFDCNRNLQTIQLPDGLTQIAEAAFECCDLRTVNIPASCKKIGIKAFRGNENLSTIIFPSNAQIMEIGERAFFETNIRQIKIPAGCKCDELYFAITKGRYKGGFWSWFNDEREEIKEYIKIERY